MQDQCGRILQLLAGANGGWVPLPEILALGVAQYAARVHELRRRGHAIENKTQWVGGVRHSWYRLGAPEQSAAAS